MPFTRLMSRRQPPDVVAAVDLGSNSFHLVVARHQHGELQVLDRIKEMVRLAAGLDDAGNLHREARDRALDCLQRFGQRLRDLPPGSVRAVGTNTLRQARNAAEFLPDAEAALGHPIEIVAGVEEARLVYQGVARSLSDDGGRRLVMDIGGSSTELIVGERFEPLLMESLSIGCVSISTRFFADDCYDSQSMAAAEEAVMLELEPVEFHYRSAGWLRAVGASGTIRAVQAAIREKGWSDGAITREALIRLRQAILKAGCARRLRFNSLGADRRPTFAAGVVVLHGVFQRLGIETMEVADGALREGVLYDLLGRFGFEDVRDHSVRALSARYQVDQAQAERVSTTASNLLVQVARQWRLDQDAEQWLVWAAQLHEVGLNIAHSQYHQHGDYIARNADMAGFSRQDQAIVATLIRAHRRKISDAVFAELPADRCTLAMRLAVLLRLAVVLHRGRQIQALPELRLRITDNGLDLRIPAQWLDSHPLTSADLKEEARYLSVLGLQLSYGAESP
ncbi:MAG: exopolyphosphatase [Aquisalimonadaceae bacterium]